MNYHIIVQDKFFDAYIEDIYQLHQEANNIFLVRGKQGETPWLKTKRKVEYLGDDYSTYMQKLQSLLPEDRLFVSWYDLFIGQAIVDSGIRNEVYVWMMGGDFYADPFWYHAEWLFDKHTLKFIKQHYGYPKINWKRRPKNWKNIYYDWKTKQKFLSEQRGLYEKKLKTIHRIDYLILPKEDVAEFNRVKELYPGSSFKMLNGVYDQNYDQAIQIEDSKKPNRILKILVGNSADPTNNYMDAYRHLKNCINGNIEIYSALSYGDEMNRQNVINEGSKMFGERFHPITEFMERQTYISFLNGMDSIVMYHNRQQACGNIMTAITLGKPVFMKSINPIYAMLRQIGITSVYDVRDLSNISLRQAIERACADREGNATRIAETYSRKVRQNYLKELL